jgi:hypothetical protein
MFKSKLRLLGVSALVGAGLIAAGPADAYNLRLGSVEVNIDTTASVGVMVRTADRDMGTGYVAEGNGGPIGKGAVVPAGAWVGVSTTSDGCTGTGGSPTGTAMNYGAQCSYSESAATGYNYAGSINQDNGRLNFDSGDLIGGALKFTSEIEADISSNITAFARVNAFLDPVLGDDGSYERAQESDKADVAGDLVLLDAYLNYDGEVFGQPLQVRLGRQVINWGEATFSLGGNSVFNPLDVNAFTRPGSEIKEAFIPVNALYGSMALPYDLTLEAYASLEHRGFKLGNPGTPFSGSDNTQATEGGTFGKVFLSSGLYSGTKFNCDLGVVAGGTDASQVTKDLANAINGVTEYTTDDTYCGDGNMDWRVHNNDIERAARGEGYDRVSDLEGDESGDVGIALRWYSEALNSTEFGLFYQKYDSRIPYGQWISNGPTLSFTNQGPNASLTGRVLAGTACFTGTGGATARGGQLLGGATEDAAFAAGMVAATGGTQLASTFATSAIGAATMVVKDPKGIASAVAAVSDFSDPNMTALTIGDELTFDEALSIICRAHIARGNLGIDGYAHPSSLDGNAGLAHGNGELSPNIGQDVDLRLVYPEDIEVMGVSFNTTAFGWGIQGEVAYRPDFPLSMDSNDAFLGALIGSCLFEQFPVFGATLNNFGRTLVAEQGISCSDQRQEVDSWFEEDIVNWTLGTTATFTRSNPITNFLGADLLVLLTEFNGVYFDAEGDHDTASEGSGLGAAQVDITSASACTYGTDIAAGGTFSIDPVPTGEAAYQGCRATRDAYEGVILVSAQYNNVFGTPISLSPRLVHREGLAGIAPRPAASYVDGVSSTNIGVTAEYQGQWKAGLSYTTYGGDRLYTKNLDRDFVAVDISYAF